MKVLLQRVSEASVTADGVCTGKINRGILLFAGFTHTDLEANAAFLAEKCVNLRIFPDSEGRMSLSVRDIGGEVLSVSQFTLYGETSKGRRPGFDAAMKPHEAERMYRYFLNCLRSAGLKVENGIFGADMKVNIVNDGPVTFLLEK
ncbi:MAG: D-tyrosyl-tRNA(Tyr) deacylase [Spirochaetes bacterium]|nr:D-tyrosyl-tRNA(Tyr) deacylase [Spirochaetota bacterium]